MIWTCFGGTLLAAQKASDARQPRTNELYVGTCYQPIDRNRILYVNSTTAQQQVTIPGDWREAMSGKSVQDRLVLAPFEAQLLERAR